MKISKLLARISSIKNIDIYLSILFIFIISLNMFLAILPVKQKYTSHDYWTRYPQLKKTYNASVYGTKYGPFIKDEYVYSYAAGALIKGTSPILINPETPPLGKYLIGLSILVFNNENISIVISVILSYFLLFLLGKQFLTSNTTALLPSLFLSFEPLFKNQFVYTPLLDTIHLSFMLSAFYFFIIAINSREKNLLYFLISSLLLGGFISTKFFGVGAAIIAAWYISIIISKNKKHFIYLTLSFPISILVLLSTYIAVLFTNYPLKQFLGIQKWVFLYNKGHIQNAFTVWPLLLFNQWHTWWGTRAVLSDAQWSILWPIATIITFVTIILYITGRIPRKRGMEMIMAWIVFYLALLSLSDANVRYFVILLPMLYLVSIYGLEYLAKKYLITGKKSYPSKIKTKNIINTKSNTNS